MTKIYGYPHDNPLVKGYSKHSLEWGEPFFQTQADYTLSERVISERVDELESKIQKLEKKVLKYQIDYKINNRRKRKCKP